MNSRSCWCGFGMASEGEEKRELYAEKNVLVGSIDHERMGKDDHACFQTFHFDHERYGQTEGRKKKG